ncbi:MAG: hypothetical protein ACTH2Q_10470 [Propionibacteriaceae bacterium]
MNPLPVEIRGERQPQCNAVLETLASLPRSFSQQPRDPEVTAVCAAQWIAAAHAAIQAGRRAIVIMEPGESDPVEVLALADAAAEAGVLVRLARRWACNPAAASFHHQDSEIGAAVLVDSHAVLDDEWTIGEALTAHLDLLASAFEASLSIRHHAHTTQGYLLSGLLRRQASETPLHVVGSRSSAVATRVRVRELTADGRRALHLDKATTAAPGLALVSDATGRHLLPTQYESGHREVWRSLHDQLGSGRHFAEDLQHFAAIQSVVRDLRLG